jgi:hypothetical protein
MRSKTSVAAFVTLSIASIVSAPCASAAPPDDACSFLTEAQVSAALGVSVAPGAHRNPANLKTCMWSPPGALTMGNDLLVSLKTADEYKNSKTLMERTQAAMKEEKDEEAGQLAITSVSGLGDDAYYASAGNHPKLNVKKGALSFSVEVLGDFPADKSKDIEKTLALQILSKL